MPRKAKPVLPAAEPVAPVVTVEPSPTITNCLRGTRLFLADGRSIEHEESADVSPEEAAFLRGRGQAK